MTPTEFTHWLKGFLAAAPAELSAQYVETIKAELGQVKPAAIATPPAAKPLVFGDMDTRNPFLNSPLIAKYDAIQAMPHTLTTGKA